MFTMFMWSFDSNNKIAWHYHCECGEFMGNNYPTEKCFTCGAVRRDMQDMNMGHINSQYDHPHPWEY